MNSQRNTDKKSPVSITELVFRDGHQSLLATRMRIDDMLPIADKLDKIGYWSTESWGGATFDSCIRFLGEDPWERIREISAAMPNTPQQMLLRGQNILGYRHYANDVVEKFVERSVINGVKIFRVFDALNDMRNIDTAIKAVLKYEGHAQGTLSYTISPLHTLDAWVKQAKDIESLGAHSLAIKDMSGLLTPYVAYDLVSKIKQQTKLRVHIHCHATTGLSTATAVKAIEAGADTVDTSISSMSMTYGHTATEAMVAILKDTPYDTGLDLDKLIEISEYFRPIRKKYAKFEGSLQGIDPRILIAQVPGGMLTNMENQLREQNMADKLGEVLIEIPKVRKELGYVPLVTPSSQIVGSQAVMNVMTGERYKTITKETEGIVRGEYGRVPGEIDKDLKQKVLKGEEPPPYDPTARPDELEELTKELQQKASEEGFKLAENEVDDVLSYALFPQVALKYFKNRNNPDAFEPKVSENDVKDSNTSAPATTAGDTGIYKVRVNNKEFMVEVAGTGASTGTLVQGAATPMATATPPPAAHAAADNTSGDEEIAAPLAGNVFKLMVSQGQEVKENDVVMIMEAMKMEAEVRSPYSGIISSIHIRQGDSVSVGAKLMSISTK
ncbi:MAG: sodium-extruding oxaloacetate decarboxylase subunit alpha [Candidatus Portiera sp.]|nr:sodium-extruding oxaloacetate decarboxylase subunit alpha [Portiera sp.]